MSFPISFVARSERAPQDEAVRTKAIRHTLSRAQAISRAPHTGEAMASCEGHSAASFRVTVMRSAMALVMKRAVIGVPS